MDYDLAIKHFTPKCLWALSILSLWSKRSGSKLALKQNAECLSKGGGFISYANTQKTESSWGNSCQGILSAGELNSLKHTRISIHVLEQNQLNPLHRQAIPGQEQDLPECSLHFTSVHHESFVVCIHTMISLHSSFAPTLIQSHPSGN